MKPLERTAGVGGLFRALGYSVDGLKAAFHSEAAFRQVAYLGLGGVIIGTLLRDRISNFVPIVVAHGITLITELLNSAVEAAVDHTSTERHPLAKRAKDLGSAASSLRWLSWPSCGHRPSRSLGRPSAFAPVPGRQS